MKDSSWGKTKIVIYFLVAVSCAAAGNDYLQSGRRVMGLWMSATAIVALLTAIWGVAASRKRS
jgi:hypothetical protein